MPHNNVELKGIVDHVGKKLIQSGFNTDCITNVTDFNSVVKRLKVRKSDGDYFYVWLLMTVCCIFHGCYQQLLFTACLPGNFTANTVVPISTGHGVNMSDSE